MEATEEDLRLSIETALSELGLTFSELRTQALTRRFSSDKAHRTWVAIAPLAHLAP